ncbi:MAG: RNA polymerase factor sigma-54 [Phycisphaerales bacterium]
MRFDTSQQMRTSQQMKLAPRMIQSMEILQMPLMELQERIEQELESNIALELANAPSEEYDAQEREEDDRLAERELVAGDEASDFARLNEYERNYADVLDGDYAPRTYSPSRHAGERDGKMDAMANTEAKDESLSEQLQHQLTFIDLHEDVADAARLLLSYLDDDGFLSLDLESILSQNHAKHIVEDGELTLDLLERALVALQGQLEPAGVAARDQRECLLLQIDRRMADAEDDRDWTTVLTLISHHYDDLLQNRLPRIVQKTELTLEDIRTAVDLMKHLTLRPGRELSSVDVPPITPDVIVEYEEASDTYLARLADGVVPLLRISNDAERLAKDNSLDRETREFASAGIRSASWLIEAIAQRQSTLLRVVNIVLARQREFFDYGSQHLKPLPMTEVADMLGVHVATVSRAVADKWLQTPRGVVPLRGFFSGGAMTDSGEEMSWEAVRATLKEIIDTEDKSKPLSDDALARSLKERGIDIARRTVVKYRQQMDIPTARLRKVH